MKNLVKITIGAGVGGIADGIRRKIPAAMQALEGEIIRSCEPFVPYRTGELCRSASAVYDGNSGDGWIIYSAKHAARCYYAERPFCKKYHPLASARWFEAAKRGDMRKWTDAAAGALSGRDQRDF